MTKTKIQQSILEAIEEYISEDYNLSIKDTWGDIPIAHDYTFEVLKSLEEEYSIRIPLNFIYNDTRLFQLADYIFKNIK